MDDLGNQTVRVIERVRGKRGVMTERPGAVWPGCSVQPVDSAEGVPLERHTRWVLYAPPGFPESSENVLAVDGIGDRLHVDGDLQTWFDGEGVAEYVWGYLERWNGKGTNG
ncbi:hypothetical protein A5N78_06520 [Prescottella equi]|uniref:hypothetical protein n=1 Tax=Rhodococcus hoagii TaxID=43767 RepID=UPI000A10C350|nr:hypothetical protein [Prescottella equi]ORL90893.1 hypothetical protein A5N78_06520 [Prescottella equi]ORM22781.1 hypothetical protein A5N70_00985 [Prescottella equi]